MTPPKDLPNLDDIDIDVGSKGQTPRGSGLLGRMFRLLIGMVIAFGAGAGWQYFESRPLRDELSTLRQELRYQRLGATLSSALAEAGAGRYEMARNQASAFFTELQGFVYAPEAGAPEALEGLLTSRDDVITALSRGELRSRDLLARLVADYQRITGQSAIPVPPPPGEASPVSAGSPAPGAVATPDTVRPPPGDSAAMPDSAAVADTVRDTIPG